MQTKVCFKCLSEKPISDFYKHPKMADGYLGKCKLCTRSDVKTNYDIKSNSIEFIDKERKRGREKHQRLYKDKPANKEVKKRAQANYAERFPEKFAAKKYATSKFVPDGFEGHHWSYNEADAKDVIPLITSHHKKAHRFLVYDQERMMYRRNDTMELLDTKQSHISFISWCIENKPN